MLTIYNTLTRNKEPFIPLAAGRVKIYVCGMTVYDYCHLGHARVMVAFDMITRYLRARNFAVTYVRNITDIDDKIIRRANENGETVAALTERFIDAMHEDERALSVLPPDLEPRATGHMDEIIAMISRLIEKGAAYQAPDGDVFYAIDTFKPYGRLSNRSPGDMLAGSRVEVDPSKRNPLDFVLWKQAKPGEVSWPSPWGAGRPGWHIECSAMSTAALGNTFDIHGGGPDLVFPHHENEIAQSEGATGCKFANCWMHAGAVRVNAEKMSKSLGNFFTIREVLADHHPEVVRYLLLASHYRSPISYSADSLTEARGALERLYTSLRDNTPCGPGESAGTDVEGVDATSAIEDGEGSDWRTRFFAAMDDDFNTPEAIAVLFDLAKTLNRSRESKQAGAFSLLAQELRSLGSVLGILQEDPERFLRATVREGGLGDEAIEELIAQRRSARDRKDWQAADRIRDQLAAEGVVLEDSAGTTTWRRSR